VFKSSLLPKFSKCNGRTCDDVILIGRTLGVLCIPKHPCVAAPVFALPLCSSSPALKHALELLERLLWSGSQQHQSKEAVQKQQQPHRKLGTCETPLIVSCHSQSVIHALLAAGVALPSCFSMVDPLLLWSRFFQVSFYLNTHNYLLLSLFGQVICDKLLLSETFHLCFFLFPFILRSFTRGRVAWHSQPHFQKCCPRSWTYCAINVYKFCTVAVHSFTATTSSQRQFSLKRRYAVAKEKKGTRDISYRLFRRSIR